MAERHNVYKKNAIAFMNEIHESPPEKRYKAFTYPYHIELVAGLDTDQLPESYFCSYELISSKLL